MGCEIKENYELARLTTFKIGGICEKLYLPDTIEDFVALLKEQTSPIIIGGGSNLLISSSGVVIPVISTSKLKEVKIEDSKITAACGVFGAFLAQTAAKLGLTGFEFLISFPGTVGGNIYMNASAHGQSMSDHFVSAKVYDKQEKQIITILKENMGFAYKKSILQTGRYILLEATFNLPKSSPDSIKEAMVRNLNSRKQSQPSMAYPNAGCVFKNPTNDSAGKLLDAAGMKGVEKQNVKVWNTHANFVVNKGNATSTDVLELMLEMYNKVKENYNIKLEPEVIFIGKKNEREEEICNIIYPRTQR